MIIGGQHIAGACKWMRQKLLRESDTTDDSELPESYRVVQAVVFKVTTPLHALILAGGYHQSCQQDNVEPSFGDVLRFFGKQSALKVQNHQGDPLLTDDKVVCSLQAIGLVRGDRDIIREQEAMGMTNDKAVEHTLTVRYNLCQLWRSTARFTVANTAILSELLTKVEHLNAQIRDRDLPPFRPQTFRENTGLMQEDYADLGRWVITKSKLSLKDLTQQMVFLKPRRGARWHIYTAPDHLVHPSNRNETTVRMLCEEIPYAAMTNSKWGGGIWRKLKYGTPSTPGWDRLKNTEL